MFATSSCPFVVQLGSLERQLLWATIDASRRRSQRAERSASGGVGHPALRSPHDSVGGGLATFLSESGSPDWVSEFRCGLLAGNFA